MKRFTKIISALLAVLMAMGSLTVAASASIPLLPYKSDDNKKYDADDLVTNKGDLNYDVDWDDTINVYLGETSTLNNSDNKDKQVIYKTPQEKLASMAMMWESDGYQLWVDDVTGEVATVKVSTGEILFSNPWNVQTASYENGENKRSTTLAVKKQLLSQIIVNYVDSDTDKVMYSCVEAAARGQISVEYIKNGIRVEYSIGREQTRMLVPKMISKTRFENKILKPMRELFNEEPTVIISDGTVKDENGKTVLPNTKDWPFGVVGEKYKHYDLVVMHNPNFNMAGELSIKYDAFEVKKVGVMYSEKNLDKAVSDREAASIMASFPITKKMPVYVFDPSASTVEQLQVERRIKDYVPSYTYEDLDYDHEETGYVGIEKAPPLFKMALEYSLDENGMSVRLPANGIRFDQSLYQLTSIEMLPYMGAGANDGDFEDGGDGYTFFPDGSGALFDFEQLNTGANKTINGKVYGQDYAYHELTGTYQETIRYPAFGIVEKWEGEKTVTDYDNVISKAVYDSNGNLLVPAKYGTKNEVVKENHGFLAIIEEGDALAELSTTHMSATSIYNTVRMIFYPRPKDTYNMADALSVGTNTKMTVTSNRKYVGSYKIRYVMLSDDTLAAENKLSSYYEASWMGMAVAYRDYLEANDVLNRLTADDVDDDIPLYIQTFGALWTTEKILSIPVDVMTPLTSFEDIKTMYTELSAAIESSMAEIAAGEDKVGTTEDSSKKFSNLNFKLTGYANGGMTSTVPYNLNWEAAVGGASGFQDLVDYSKEEGFDLFPDFDFVYINKEEIFDGVSLRYDAVKTIDNRYTGRRIYSATTQNYQGYFGLAITPSCFERLVTKLAENYIKYNPTGISVSTLGSDLNSDFDEEDPLNREDSKKYTIEALSHLSQLAADGAQSIQVMTDGGNAYSWKYVDHIVNMPLNSSRYNISSNAVPFIGVVLHGYVQFAGTPINEEGDIEYAFLKAIENGANLYFTLSYQNTQKLKEYTDLSKYFSVRYEIWKDDVVDMYVELNDLLCDLQTKLIIDHDFLVGNRVPDDPELKEDKENAQKAEDLKLAADTIEAIKQSLKDALALRHTPTESVEKIEQSLKNAGEQAKTLAKQVGRLDATNVQACVELIRTVKSAENAVKAAKLDTFNGDAYDAAVDAVEALVADVITAKASFESDKLIAALGDAEKATALELQQALITAAIDNIAAKSAAIAKDNYGKSYLSAAEEKAALVAEITALISDVETAMKAVDNKGLAAIAEAMISNIKSAFEAGVAAEAISAAKKGYTDAMNSINTKFDGAVNSKVNLETLLKNAVDSLGITQDNVNNAVNLYTNLENIKYQLSVATGVKNSFTGNTGKVYLAYDAPIIDLYKKLAAIVTSGEFKDASGKALTSAVKNAASKTIPDLERNQALFDLYTAIGSDDFTSKLSTLTTNIKANTNSYNNLNEATKEAANAVWALVLSGVAAVEADPATTYASLVKKINSLSVEYEAIYLQHSREELKEAVKLINEADRYEAIKVVAELYHAIDGSFTSYKAVAQATDDYNTAIALVNALDETIKTRADRVFERCADIAPGVENATNSTLDKLYLDAAVANVTFKAAKETLAVELVSYNEALAAITALEADKLAAETLVAETEQVAIDGSAVEAVLQAKKAEFEAKAGNGKAAEITKIIDSIAKAQANFDVADADYQIVKALNNPTGDTTDAWKSNCTTTEINEHNNKLNKRNEQRRKLDAEIAKLDDAKDTYSDCAAELEALIAAYNDHVAASEKTNAILAIAAEIANLIAKGEEIGLDKPEVNALFNQAVAAKIERNKLDTAVYKTAIDSVAAALDGIKTEFNNAKAALDAANAAVIALQARVESTKTEKAAAEWLASCYEIAAQIAKYSVSELKLLSMNTEEGTAEKLLYTRAYTVVTTDIDVLKANAEAATEEKSEAALLYEVAKANEAHSRDGLVELNESYQQKLITAQREMNNAQKFYETGVKDAAEAQVKYDELAALYESNKQSYESLVALQTSVLLFGEDNLAALNASILADVRRVNDLYDEIAGSIEKVSAEWDKLKAAAELYKSAQDKTEAVDAIEAAVAAITAEYTDNFKTKYADLNRRINNVLTVHEQSVKTQMELAETLYNKVKDDAAISNEVKADAKSVYDNAKALYELIEEKNDKFVSDDATKSELDVLLEGACELGLLVKSENAGYTAPETVAKLTEYVNELYGIVEVTEEEKQEASKYICDDGSIVSVTYGGKNGNDAEAYRTFLLNFNSFKVTVTYGGVEYTIDAYGYQVINH